MHYKTKDMIIDALRKPSALLYNILHFAEHSPYDAELAALRNLVLSMPSDEKEPYRRECEFVRNMPLDNLAKITFPYRELGDRITTDSIVSGSDCGFPYVVHKERRLFFPKSLSPDEAAKEYMDLVFREGLLGNGILEKSPHRYVTDYFKVSDGDVLLDVGCAEALFALDTIDRVSKAYLFECEKAWRKPLHLTFAPFAEKVVFVEKLVSDKTSKKTTNLINAVHEDMKHGATFFVKMDIEGWERTVLKGNVDFFKGARIKLACCCYHRQDDALIIDKLLRNMGYKTQFSEGWMLPTMNGIHYPYFRHGVIYAQNFL